MIKQTSLALAVGFALTGCMDTQTNTNNTEVTTKAAVEQSAQLTENQKLNQVVENYFDEALAFSPVSGTYVGESQYNNQWSPVISAENRAKATAFTKKYQASLAKIDSAKLTNYDFNFENPKTFNPEKRENPSSSKML